MTADDGGQARAEGLSQLFAHGQALHASGDARRAKAVYEAVLKADPGHLEAWQALALLALHQGEAGYALGVFDRLVDAGVVNAPLQRHRADALNRLQRPNEALAAMEAALALAPDDLAALRLKGQILRAEGRHAEAEAVLLRALAQAPEDIPALSELAAARLGQGRAEEALVDLDEVVRRSPADPASHFNRGNALRLLMRIDDAVEAYDRALTLKPKAPMVRFNRANCLLLRGDWAEGFQEYEHRHACPGYEKPAQPGLPWRGDRPLAGRTLLVTPELYFGDLIQFSRFALLAEREGAQVVLTAPRPAHRLMSTLSPTLRLIAPDEAPPAVDLHCPLMSLAGAFRSRPTAVFNETPYLSPEPARLARWRAHIGEAGLKVGVVWQGSTQPYALPLQRSFPLAGLAGLAARPGVRLISLQKMNGLDQLTTLPSGMSVETLPDFDAGPDMFLDTAAAMAACDLVISCDTGTAHLAGALGARTWIALPFTPDWRWLMGRDDSPWYPTARLFRQTVRGDWTAVFDAMAAALPA